MDIACWTTLWPMCPSALPWVCTLWVMVLTVPTYVPALMLIAVLACLAARCVPRQQRSAPAVDADDGTCIAHRTRAKTMAAPLNKSW